MGETIEKFDYTKAPPGYAEHPFRGGAPPHRFSFAFTAPDKMTVLDSAGTTSESEAIAAAWTHYKREHDPPGLRLVWEVDDRHFEPDGSGEWHVDLTSTMGHVRSMFFRAFANRASGEADIRAATWAWHDRRLALATRLKGEGVQLDMWPASLAWTDDECRECETWPGMHALPDDFPAVLRHLNENADRDEHWPPKADDEQEALAQAAVQLAEDEVGQLQQAFSAGLACGLARCADNGTPGCGETEGHGPSGCDTSDPLADLAAASGLPLVFHPKHTAKSAALAASETSRCVIEVDDRGQVPT